MSSSKQPVPGGTSTFTVEGNSAGSLASKIEQQQQQKRDLLAAERERIAAEARRKTEFTATDAAAAASASQFTQRVTGLATIEGYRQAKEEAASKEAAAKIKASLAASASASNPAFGAGAAGGLRPGGAVDALKRKRPALSFAGAGDDEDSEEDGGQSSSALVAKRPRVADEKGAAALPIPTKLGKDPTAATDFLPDAEREKQAAILAEMLRKEFLEKQAQEKASVIEVTYSYWDGTGHRRTIKVTKGTTIGKFLEAVRQSLENEFPGLRKVTSSQLIFVKEDLILPHAITFYELIAHKVRGKSGPLFDFSVKDDVRMTLDTRVEKEESHPGKVIERAVYERGKHQFPYSRYEVWDWSKKDAFDKYTTHGAEVNAKDGGKR